MPVPAAYRPQDRDVFFKYRGQANAAGTSIVFVLVLFWGCTVCLSVEEWRAWFPNCAVSEQKQFAHDLVRHITQLHEAGRLTADFLQIAVSSLGKSIELDTAFRALVVDALKCLKARAAAVPSMRAAFRPG